MKVAGKILLALSCSSLLALLLRGLGLPNIIEPFFIFSILLLNKRIKISKSFLLSVPILILLGIYGMILTSTGFTNIYRDLRVVLVGLLLYTNIKKIKSNEIIQLSLLFLFFELISIILANSSFFQNTDLIRTNIPIILIGTILMMQKSPTSNVSKIILISLIFFIWYSNMRNTVILSIILLVLYFLKILRKSLLFSIPIIAVFIYIGISYYNYAISDPELFLHTFKRSFSLLNDKLIYVEPERYYSFITPFIKFSDFILPHGIGSWGQIELVQKISDNKLLSSFDSLFFFYTFHYGWILFIIFIFRFFLFVYNIRMSIAYFWFLFVLAFWLISQSLLMMHINVMFGFIISLILLKNDSRIRV